MNVVIASRLLRHSSDVLLKELESIAVRLISPIPVTEREVEIFVQAIKSFGYTGVSTRVIFPKTSHLKVERLRNKIDGKFLSSVDRLVL